MLVLKIPNKTSNSMDKMMRDFLQGDGLGKTKKLHIVKWNDLCKPIDEEGFGITCQNMLETYNE